MELDNKPERAERLISRQEDESLLVFDSDTGAIKVLNETAALIWNNIDGTTSIKEIIGIIAEEYPDENRDIIEEEVLTFLEELQSHEFIH